MTSRDWTPEGELRVPRSRADDRGCVLAQTCRMSDRENV